MNILKKELNMRMEFINMKLQINCKKIINFYDQHPFPNYKKNENITDLIYNTKNNIFINELKNLC